MGGVCKRKLISLCGLFPRQLVAGGKGRTSRTVRQKTVINPDTNLGVYLSFFLLGEKNLVLDLNKRSSTRCPSHWTPKSSVHETGTRRSVNSFSKDLEGVPLPWSVSFFINFSCPFRCHTPETRSPLLQRPTLSSRRTSVPRLS